MLADPIRGRDYRRYQRVHCMTPNRLEAGLATGMVLQTPDEAIIAGRKLVRELEMDAILVTLDRDGMALVRADGREQLVPTRPRQVYDITGAGDMVLAVIGLCLAAGADYDEAAALGNVAGGLEVEKIGVALLSREEILRDLFEHHHPERSKRPGWEHAVAEVRRRQVAGQKVVFTNGCFDLLHVGHIRLLRQAAALGDYLVVGLNSDASVQRLKGPRGPSPARTNAPSCSRPWSASMRWSSSRKTRRWSSINAIGPDVLVKGGDYRPEEVVGRAEVEARGGRLVLIPLVEGRSTSGLVRRLADRTVIAHGPEPEPPAPVVGRGVGVRQDEASRA